MSNAAYPPFSAAPPHPPGRGRFRVDDADGAIGRCAPPALWQSIKDPRACPDAAASPWRLLAPKNVRRSEPEGPIGSPHLARTWIHAPKHDPRRHRDAYFATDTDVRAGRIATSWPFIDSPSGSVRRLSIDSIA